MTYISKASLLNLKDFIDKRATTLHYQLPDDQHRQNIVTAHSLAVHYKGTELDLDRNKMSQWGNNSTLNTDKRLLEMIKDYQENNQLA